jgi:type IV secretory pathway TrbD component
MKIVSKIGLLIAIIGLIAGVYCQIEIVPTYNHFNTVTMSDLEIPIWRSYGDQKFMLGSIALFTGILAAVIGLVGGLKKHKVGWVALFVGVFSLVLGLMQSTHMFN